MWVKWVAAISLIATFAWMVLSACWMPVDAMLKKKELMLSMGELEGALSSYQLDHGEYPLNSDDELEGAFVLYKYLSGDFDGDGKLDPESVGTKVYLESIDWKDERNESYSVVSKIGSRYALVDPHGSPIRYLCEPFGKKNKKTRNPAYDLWSLGGAEPNSDAIEHRSKWITNWD